LDAYALFDGKPALAAKFTTSLSNLFPFALLGDAIFFSF
jgi:hypothetical protein